MRLMGEKLVDFRWPLRPNNDLFLICVKMPLPLGLLSDFFTHICKAHGALANLVGFLGWPSYCISSQQYTRVKRP